MWFQPQVGSAGWDREAFEGEHARSARGARRGIRVLRGGRTDGLGYDGGGIEELQTCYTPVKVFLRTAEKKGSTRGGGQRGSFCALSSNSRNCTVREVLFGFDEARNRANSI